MSVVKKCGTDEIWISRKLNVNSKYMMGSNFYNTNDKHEEFYIDFTYLYSVGGKLQCVI